MDDTLPIESLFSSGAVVIIAILLVVLLVLWFLLPFAIFGTKGKLDNIDNQLKKTNKLLTEIHRQLGGQQSDDLPRFSTKKNKTG